MGEDMEEDFQILMRQPAKRERHFNWAAHAQCPKGTLNFFSFSFAQCQRYGDLHAICAHRVTMRYFNTVRLSKLAIKMYSSQICQLCEILSQSEWPVLHTIYNNDFLTPINNFSPMCAH